MRIKIELEMYERNPDRPIEGLNDLEGPARELPELSLEEEVHEHLCKAFYEASPSDIEWLGAYVLDIKVVTE